ncbi:endonuclease domain-containing protein [Blastococcus sp. SYSU DS0510]
MAYDIAELLGPDGWATRAPGMPRSTQQRQVTVGGRTHHLDAAYDDVLLAVEMDGAAWHGSREQRERDIRRDVLLATAGWQTLRFSHRRLTASAPVSGRRPPARRGRSPAARTPARGPTRRAVRCTR